MESGSSSARTNTAETASPVARPGFSKSPCIAQYDLLRWWELRRAGGFGSGTVVASGHYGSDLGFSTTLTCCRANQGKNTWMRTERNTNQKSAVALPKRGDEIRERLWKVGGQRIEGKVAAASDTIEKRSGGADGNPMFVGTRIVRAIASTGAERVGSNP